MDFSDPTIKWIVQQYDEFEDPDLRAEFLAVHGILAERIPAWRRWQAREAAARSRGRARGPQEPVVVLAVGPARRRYRSRRRGGGTAFTRLRVVGLRDLRRPPSRELS